MLLVLCCALRSQELQVSAYELLCGQPMLLFSKLDMLSGIYDHFEVPHCRSSLDNRILVELFSEPDIFGFQWAATNVYNGVTYPALPDLYGPTMNVRSSCPPLFIFPGL